MNGSSHLSSNGTIRDDQPDVASHGAAPAVVPKRSARERRKRLVKKLVRPLTAGRLWYYSTRAYRAKLYPIAWFIKTMSFLLFKSNLCVQCEIADDVYMVHQGMGCVIHPNVTIGKNVKMFHHVTMAAETTPGSPSRIIVEDDVVIGAHALLIGNDEGGIRIGRGAVIGAGAIVTRDVPPKAVVLPLPSRPVKMIKSYD